MTTSLYRFRPLNTHTIDELKNSYLYFSTIDKLNDPMECFYRLFFNENEKLYKNLFKNFLQAMRLVSIDSKLNGKEIVKQNIVKKVFGFENEFFGDLDKWIDENCMDCIDLLKDKEIWENKLKEQLVKIYERFYQRNDMELKCVEFRVTKYLTQLRQFVVSELLVCCFSKFKAINENCIDLSNNKILMWAHYASGHSGICLEFDEIEPQISLENKLESKKINYVDRKNYNVKNLQFSVGLALSNADIKMNFLPKPITIQDLRNIYSKKYEYIYHTKLDVWKYESEYRYSIRKSDLIDSKGLLTQKLKYDFKCLKSITFGERTPQDERDEIIEIINKKCEKYNHKVAFYEVYIDDSCGKFKRSRIEI